MHSKFAAGAAGVVCSRAHAPRPMEKQMPDSMLGQRVRCAIPTLDQNFEIAYGKVIIAPMPEHVVRIYTVLLDNGVEKRLNYRYLSQVEETAGNGHHNRLVIDIFDSMACWGDILDSVGGQLNEGTCSGEVLNGTVKFNMTGLA
jgi:hypothetical protein